MNASKRCVRKEKNKTKETTTKKQNRKILHSSRDVQLSPQLTRNILNDEEGVLWGNSLSLLKPNPECKGVALESGSPRYGCSGDGGMSNSVTWFGHLNFTFLWSSLVWLPVHTIPLMLGVHGGFLSSALAQVMIGWNVHINFTPDNNRDIPQIKGIWRVWLTEGSDPVTTNLLS